MRFFEKQVDRRSRSAMIDFLVGHFRYDTASSVNRRTSYANRVKIHKLGLSSQQQDAAYALLGSDEDIWGQLETHVYDFTRRHNGAYTMGLNGRSDGYIVLYNSHYRDTGCKSSCRSCGQLNYKRVADLPADPAERLAAQAILTNGSALTVADHLEQSAVRDLPGTVDDKVAFIRRIKALPKDCTASNRCGRCGAEGERGRVNLAQPQRTLETSIGGIDGDADFSDWSLSDLRDRVNLVCDFDRACDAIRDTFIDMLGACSVEEEVVMAPKTVRRVVCAGAAPHPSMHAGPAAQWIKSRQRPAAMPDPPSSSSPHQDGRTAR